jgi:hypothetical protein
VLRATWRRENTPLMEQHEQLTARAQETLEGEE